MKPARWLTLAGGSFLIGLLVFLPAAMIEAPVNRALAPYATLSGTQGTIWSGAGVISAMGNLVPVQWRFAPLGLMRLRLAYQVTPSSPAINGQVRVSAGFSDARMEDTELTLDGKLIHADGQVKLDGEGSLSLDAKREISFSGVAVPSRDAKQLTTLLQTLGKPQPDGRILIDYRGTLK